MLNGKSILITGGTGSFGHKCTELLLKNYKPSRIIIFSRDEMKQWEMARVFPFEKYSCMRYFIGDVRDRDRLHRAFSQVDYIIHAAAMKIVPTGEFNPFEVIKTNIVGAENVINEAIDHGVEKVLALSTDKAANPVNLYGATKLCADKLFAAGNQYASHQGTRFSLVRYGNVLGSRGSVIPLFLKQRESGEITLTDPEMTRFWITLEQGVLFVLRCLEIMVGGELFVPKLPSMTMGALAEAVAPGCRQKIIGLRPGEKIHETMISKDDAWQTVEFDDYYVVKPLAGFQYPFDESRGRTVPRNFEYNSCMNPWKLSPSELLEMIADMPAVGARARD